MSKKEYKEGYVAFLDILGFSSLVKREDATEIAKLFEVIERLKRLFNSIDGIEMDFFSDSIVLMSTSESYLGFLLPLYVAESYLTNEFGLVFRGAITKGKYYHDEVNTFGPAIVKAYGLEGKAKFSRIVIDKDSIDVPYDTLEVFYDGDGIPCLNTYSFTMWQDIRDGSDGSDYKKEDLFEMMISSLKEIRQSILNLCDFNRDCEYFTYYYWRSIPFNYLCDFISNDPEDVEYINKHYSQFSESEKKQIQDLKIYWDAFVQ